jgi:hypothetical protein
VVIAAPAQGDTHDPDDILIEDLVVATTTTASTTTTTQAPTTQQQSKNWTPKYNLSKKGISQVFCFVLEIQEKLRSNVLR